MDEESKQQTEQFVRVGAAAMIQGAKLEDVLNIATTGLSVIDKLRAVELPKPPAKPTRKR
jgi:hypothetical protein